MPLAPDTAGRRPGTPAQALDLAAHALHAGRPREAEQLAAAVLKADRSNTPAGQILATALLMQDRPAEAVELLRALARRVADPAVETLLAKALIASGEAGAALEALRRAITRRPPYPLAFLDLGQALGAVGRPGEGIVVLEDGLALVPAADGLRIALGYLHLQRGDRHAAQAQFAAVHAAAPHRQDAVVGLARIASLAGDHAAAAELYRRALVLRPGDFAAGLGLGRSLLETGKRLAGEAALRTAVGGVEHMSGPAISTLAAAPHGRFFLRPSAARKFLGA